MAARLIEFEGIDGSGKGTQSRALTDRLAAEGLRVELLSFPRYSQTRFGRAIGDFLNGRFGELNQVSPWLASVLYAGDRFESLAVLNHAMEENDVVVLDRYVASNIAHQGARVAADERTALLEWIDEVEHTVFGLPRPDLVILLDIPVEHSQELIARKPTRDYTDKAADLQEANVVYLQSVRQFYLELAGNDAWQTIDCVQNGTIRDVDAVAADVRAIVAESLGIPVTQR